MEKAFRSNDNEASESEFASLQSRFPRLLVQAEAPPVFDEASESSVLCGIRPLAYLPLAPRLYEDASPKIPARLGPISRVGATYRTAH